MRPDLHYICITFALHSTKLAYCRCGTPTAPWSFIRVTNYKGCNPRHQTSLALHSLKQPAAQSWKRMFGPGFWPVFGMLKAPNTFLQLASGYPRCLCPGCSLAKLGRSRQIADPDRWLWPTGWDHWWDLRRCKRGSAKLGQQELSPRFHRCSVCSGGCHQISWYSCNMFSQRYKVSIC